jgi:NAD(P)-dependent dehydrogenase (short-subunit alcohol dehydrogenase family)
VSTATVDVSSRASVQALVAMATDIGEISGLIHAAGVSPTQASPETILKVDLYGTALVLEQFGNVIARGGAGVVIASQSGHRLPPLSVEQNVALATTPVEELLALPMLQPDQVTDPLRAKGWYRYRGVRKGATSNFQELRLEKDRLRLHPP